MKFGDRVLFTEAGETYTATVLRQRFLDDHLGANQEPLLDIGFFKPVMKPDSKGVMVVKDVVGTEAQSELVQFRIDVAHASHEFNPAAKKKYHLTYGGVRRVNDGVVDHVVNYPGGRWEELPETQVQGHISDEEETAIVPADGTYVEDSGSTFSQGDGVQEAAPLVADPVEPEYNGEDAEDKDANVQG